MKQGSKRGNGRKWFDSSHASLCVLGGFLRTIGFFRPLEEQVIIKQKVRRYTPAAKLRMLFVSLLAGAKAVSHTGFTLRTDRALQVAFGLDGCAEQSVLSQTLDAATEAEVTALRGVLAQMFVEHSQARRHDFDHGLLVLDLDLSPLPASKRAEGATKGYMGRCRSKIGRKLVRVRASDYQETVWEDVREGRIVETLPLVQEAVLVAEALLGLDGDDAATTAKRAQTEWRLDSGWGSEATLNWLLTRGYQVTGKFKTSLRLPKLVAGITTWESTAVAGRDLAPLPVPWPLDRPTCQLAVRTPSTKKEGGFQYAILVSSRLELDHQAVVAHYDGRAGIEADLKSDKYGLGLAGLRKHKLAAQKLLVLLVGLAHNVLIWARRWLAAKAPKLAEFGIVRLVQTVWAVPGRVKVVDDQLTGIRLCRAHPLARHVLQGLRPLLATGQTLGFLD